MQKVTGLFPGQYLTQISIEQIVVLKIKRKTIFYFVPGPKGVINDWRKFKLESEDSDSVPPSKKEILRQMSSPQSRDDKDSKERFSRKVRRNQ